MLRPGALPRYLEITETLVREIASGHLADGQRLPPEREMAAQMGVAVGTMRRALQLLDQRGLLQRLQGSGNYVQARNDTSSIYALFRLELLTGGGLPTAQVLSVERLRKDPTLPRFGSHAEGHRIRRLRFLSGIPAAVEEIWLDCACCDQLDTDGLSDSLYLHYRTRLGLQVTAIEDRIGQSPLPTWSPPGFHCSPGQQLPSITRLASTITGATIEASRTWYDPASVAYVARL